MNIAFDFDGCLTKGYIQKLAKSFILGDNTVFIITSREKKLDNSAVYTVAKKLKILKKNIIFTEGKPKSEFVKGIDIIFDDMPEEVLKINNDTKTKAFLIDLNASCLRYIHYNV